MRILVTGANGFIGSYITIDQEKFPTAEVIYCDFNIDLTPQSWINRLNNIYSY